MDAAAASGTSAQHNISVERLSAWLSAHVAGFHAPVAVEPFSGGQSNPTFRLKAASREYVLRRKPIGSVLPSAHAVDREFRVLHALAGMGVPVPHVHALCTDESVIGSMFYVMDLVPGRIFWDARLPGLPAADRAAIYDSMSETIARIHSLDPAAIGLDDYGRKGAYLECQVARWSKQYQASETGPNPAMDRLMEWLPQYLPAESDIRLVHGDYRLDNLIIHPTEPRVIAVLDWELSTLGDPIADFAYHVMTWRTSPDLFRGIAGSNFAMSGIPAESEYLNSYLQRVSRGRPNHWEFYLVLSLFRVAAILQGIAKRSIDGTASNADAAEVGAKAVPLSKLAWDLAQSITS
jgi:aminoglycoside phosphotransferase (APT) family kinase protein